MDPVIVRTVNFEEVQQALRDAPDVAYTYVKSEMGRAANRFRTQVIQQRLRGRPGLNWGERKKIGGNIKTEVTGRALAGLVLRVRASRFLAAHEYGAMITAKDGGWLYLRTGKEGHGAGGFESSGGGVSKSEALIFARVRSVTLPARLGYRAVWDSMRPDIIKGIEAALGRAMQVAFERRMQSLVGALERWAA